MRSSRKISQGYGFMSWLMIWISVGLSACASVSPEAHANQSSNSGVLVRAGEIQPPSKQADVLTASQFLEMLQSSFDRDTGKLNLAAIKRHFGAEFKPPLIADKNTSTEPWVEIKTASALSIAGVDAMTLRQSAVSLPIDTTVPSGRVASARSVLQQDLEIRLQANQLCVEPATVQHTFKMQFQSGLYRYGGASRMAAPSWSHGAPEAMQTLQKSRGNGPWVNVITIQGAQNRSSDLSIHFEHEFYACAQRVLLRARA